MGSGIKSQCLPHSPPCGTVCDPYLRASKALQRMQRIIQRPTNKSTMNTTLYISHSQNYEND